ncbi:MAG: NAD(P)-dependent oxidoreductase [Phyllobacteriaceae bacterium]|nr:NAD(P)-dependent oxidoreductase [Phyllobacteriaceae bacterium]
MATSNPSTQTRIAFLGLGAMGSRMVARLAATEGFHVTVWNRSPQAALALSGVTVAQSARAAAEGADFVFSMVTDDNAAKAVWLGAEGALAGMKAGATAIEVSTVSLDWIGALAAQAAQRGIYFVDAPVAGSRPQADAGQLIFMVGGDTAVLDAVRPVLAPMAAKVLHTGPVGTGAMLKLAVNGLFAVQLATVAELLGILSKGGIAATDAATMLGEFPIVAAPIAGSAKMMAAGNTTPMFTIDLIAKDLGYAQAAAASASARLPMINAAATVAQNAIAAGLGGANVSGFAKLY